MAFCHVVTLTEKNESCNEVESVLYQLTPTILLEMFKQILVKIWFGKITSHFIFSEITLHFIFTPATYLEFIVQLN